jgi:hypothetical protein
MSTVNIEGLKSKDFYHEVKSPYQEALVLVESSLPHPSLIQLVVKEKLSDVILNIRITSRLISLGNISDELAACLVYLESRQSLSNLSRSMSHILADRVNAVDLDTVITSPAIADATLTSLILNNTPRSNKLTKLLTKVLLHTSSKEVVLSILTHPGTDIVSKESMTWVINKLSPNTSELVGKRLDTVLLPLVNASLQVNNLYTQDGVLGEDFKRLGSLLEPLDYLLKLARDVNLSSSITGKITSLRNKLISSESALLYHMYLYLSSESPSVVSVIDGVCSYPSAVSVKSYSQINLITSTTPKLPKTNSNNLLRAYQVLSQLDCEVLNHDRYSDVMSLLTNPTSSIIQARKDDVTSYSKLIEVVEESITSLTSLDYSQLSDINLSVILLPAITSLESIKDLADNYLELSNRSLYTLQLVSTQIKSLSLCNGDSRQDKRLKIVEDISKRFEDQLVTRYLAETISKLKSNALSASDYYSKLVTTNCGEASRKKMAASYSLAINAAVTHLLKDKVLRARVVSEYKSNLSDATNNIPRYISTSKDSSLIIPKAKIRFKGA